jgi:hypothetical protein
MGNPERQRKLADAVGQAAPHGFLLSHCEMRSRRAEQLQTRLACRMSGHLRDVEGLRSRSHTGSRLTLSGISLASVFVQPSLPSSHAVRAALLCGQVASGHASSS